MSTDSVLGQIVALERLGGLELRQRYAQLFGVDPPNSNKLWLKGAIAYRLQECEYRSSLSDMAKAQINIALQDNGYRPSTGKPLKGQRTMDGRTLQVAPGTMVTREYRGVKYTITALPHGRWTFEGLRYESTSAIARQITGIRISGPEFFGLKVDASGARKTKKRRRK